MSMKRAKDPFSRGCFRAKGVIHSLIPDTHISLRKIRPSMTFNLGKRAIDVL